jgi:hypothetical protein
MEQMKRDLLAAKLHGLQSCNYCQSLAPIRKRYHEAVRDNVWLGCMGCIQILVDFIEKEYE